MYLGISQLIPVLLKPPKSGNGRIRTYSDTAKNSGDNLCELTQNVV